MSDPEEKQKEEDNTEYPQGDGESYYGNSRDVDACARSDKRGLFWVPKEGGSDEYHNYVGQCVFLFKPKHVLVPVDKVEDGDTESQQKVGVSPESQDGRGVRGRVPLLLRLVVPALGRRIGIRAYLLDGKLLGNLSPSSKLRIDVARDDDGEDEDDERQVRDDGPNADDNAEDGEHEHWQGVSRIILHQQFNEFGLGLILESIVVWEVPLMQKGPQFGFRLRGVG